MLRVEVVGNELVAYIRDVSDSITRAEFDETIAGKVFPRCIKNKVSEEREEENGRSRKG